MTRIIERTDEDRFLIEKIKGNPLFRKAFTFDDIISAAVNGDLVLELSEDDGTEVLEESNLEEIQRVMPFIMRIFDKPRTFIRSSAEKVPIDTAKRINYMAISKLTRDSSDWYARTTLTVKPKNVMAEVSEETLDLYENRFVCTLVDKLMEVIQENKRACEEDLKKYRDDITLIALEREYQLNESTRFYNKITKMSAKIGREYELNTYLSTLNNRLNILRNLEKKILALRTSDLYHEFRLKKRVKDPIQKTNIILFDQSYNQAYRLWNYLKDTHKIMVLRTLTQPIDSQDLQSAYILYSFLCLCVSLYDLGFEDKGRTSIYFDGRTVHTERFVLKRERDGSIIECEPKEDHIVLRHKIGTYASKVWSEFWLRPRYDDFESMSPECIEDLTDELMTNMAVKKKGTDPDRREYALVSINISRSESKSSMSERLKHRFYSIGDNFSLDESDKHLKEWAGHKKGMILVTPSSLRANMLKIEKILNLTTYQSVLERFGWDNLKQCPICGDTNHFKKGRDGDYICGGCKRRYSMTFCNHCDPKHKKSFPWIRYENEKFLSNNDVMQGYSEMPIHNQMSKIENIMRECTTTFFDIVKEGNKFKLKTICPRCCHVLGDDVGKKHDAS